MNVAASEAPLGRAPLGTTGADFGAEGVVHHAFQMGANPVGLAGPGAKAEAVARGEFGPNHLFVHHRVLVGNEDRRHAGIQQLVKAVVAGRR